MYRNFRSENQHILMWLDQNHFKLTLFKITNISQLELNSQPFGFLLNNLEILVIRSTPHWIPIVFRLATSSLLGASSTHQALWQSLTTSGWENQKINEFLDGKVYISCWQVATYKLCYHKPNQLLVTSFQTTKKLFEGDRKIVFCFLMVRTWAQDNKSKSQLDGCMFAKERERFEATTTEGNEYSFFAWS